jgi:hypothetical protein
MVPLSRTWARRLSKQLELACQDFGQSDRSEAVSSKVRRELCRVLQNFLDIFLVYTIMYTVHLLYRIFLHAMLSIAVIHRYIGEAQILTFWSGFIKS